KGGPSEEGNAAEALIAGSAKFCSVRLFSAIEFEVGPQFVDAPPGRRIHFNFVGPATGKSFFGPFASCVDAHLRSEILPPRGVIESIDRTQYKLNVAFRVDRAERLPNHLARVLHVDIVVDDHDYLGKHGLPARPDAVHRLSRMARVALANRDNHQIL